MLAISMFLSFMFLALFMSRITGHAVVDRACKKLVSMAMGQ